MTEKLLQYIWQFQYFNQADLRTTGGDAVEVIRPGKWNKDQGPDFTNAQVRIGNLTLAGSVELHIRSSQWNEHGHQHDPNYGNVILHVVLEHNMRSTPVPVLELGSRIPRMLLDKYSSLMGSSGFIPCASSITEVKEVVWMAWKERLVAERLTRKAAHIVECLRQTTMHWEEIFWWMIARNFGMRINADAFESIARSLPLVLLSRHKHQLQQVEALLLGQGHLLDVEFSEDYPKLLQREYRFLKKKYALTPVHQPLHFLRMRPGNFPTIRLAQLAVLLKDLPQLFAMITGEASIAEIRTLLTVTANDYWHYHYLPDEASPYRQKTLGKTMIDSLVINTLVPVIFAYGLYHKLGSLQDKAIVWLQETAREENSVTKGYRDLGIANASAFDSQALLELKTHYCDERQCLSCAVGNALLKRTGMEQLAANRPVS